MTLVTYGSKTPLRSNVRYECGTQLPLSGPRRLGTFRAFGRGRYPESGQPKAALHARQLASAPPRVAALSEPRMSGEVCMTKVAVHEDRSSGCIPVALSTNGGRRAAGEI